MRLKCILQLVFLVRFDRGRLQQDWMSFDWDFQPAENVTGQATGAFPTLLASHQDGCSDVLQADSSGTCKGAALCSAAALLGIAKVKLESAEMPLALCSVAKRN